MPPTNSRPDTRRHLIVALVAVLALLGLSSCGSDSDGDGAAAASETPSPSDTSSPTSSTSAAAGPACDESSLLGALPASSTMSKYACDYVDGVHWAAVEVQEGPTVFFLKADGDTWSPMTSDEVCGTASAGLPEKLLDFCSGETPAASASANAAGGSCQADALLANLEKGSTMKKFTCAEVEGDTWAAVLINQGPTLFFMRQAGKTWDVSTADEICGAASAGFPEKLLAYCPG